MLRAVSTFYLVLLRVDFLTGQFIISAKGLADAKRGVGRRAGLMRTASQISDAELDPPLDGQ